MGSYMETLGNRAKAASREAAALGTEEKNRGLLSVAEELCQETERLLEENEKDVRAAEENGMKSSLVDRLRLTEHFLRQDRRSGRKIERFTSGHGNRLQGSKFIACSTFCMD